MIRALVTGFVQNWDVLCIQQLQQCKTPKAILTTYASSNLDETGENLHHTRFQILLENRTSRFSVKRQPSRTLVSFLHPRLHIAKDLYSWSSRLCRAGTKQGEHSMTHIYQIQRWKFKIHDEYVRSIQAERLCVFNR